MEKIKISISRKYSFSFSDGTCRAEVVAALPTLEGTRHIHPLLRASEDFWGWTLVDNWGNCPDDSDGKFRRLTLKFYAPSWEELHERIDARIESELQILEGVLSRARASLEAQPDDTTDYFWI